MGCYGVKTFEVPDNMLKKDIAIHLRDKIILDLPNRELNKCLWESGKVMGDNKPSPAYNIGRYKGTNHYIFSKDGEVRFEYKYMLEGDKEDYEGMKDKTWRILPDKKRIKKLGIRDLTSEFWYGDDISPDLKPLIIERLKELLRTYGLGRTGIEISYGAVAEIILKEVFEKQNIEGLPTNYYKFEDMIFKTVRAGDYSEDLYLVKKKGNEKVYEVY